MMKVLGIETVAKIGTVAVFEDNKLLCRKIVNSELDHAAYLIDTIDDLLKSINLSIEEINVIGVDKGPGSFTGIRVGIACAYGLAEPNNIPVVGICSLDNLCYKVYKDVKAEYYVPLIDAKRGEVYSGIYQIKNDNIVINKKACVQPLEELVKILPENSYVFGPDMNKFAGLIKDMPESVIVGKEDIFPEAEITAMRAGRELLTGRNKKPVVPMYLYDKITTKSKPR